jgi:hypothetical protein
MTSPNKALHLVPSEPTQEIAQPSAEAQSISLVREQVDETLSPKKLSDQLAILMIKLAKFQFDPLEAHDFLDQFDQFLAKKPYGAVGLAQMVESLYGDLQVMLSTALACNTLEQMTGQQEFLNERVAGMAEKVRLYAEKAEEETERMHAL